MGLANANKVYRKSGGSPTIAFSPISRRLNSKVKAKGAPGLAFETWDPGNRSLMETQHAPLSSRDADSRFAR
jgi:hypothetical protein